METKSSDTVTLASERDQKLVLWNHWKKNYSAYSSLLHGDCSAFHSTRYKREHFLVLFSQEVLIQFSQGQVSINGTRQWRYLNNECTVFWIILIGWNKARHYSQPQRYPLENHNSFFILKIKLKSIYHPPREQLNICRKHITWGNVDPNWNIYLNRLHTFSNNGYIYILVCSACTVSCTKSSLSMWFLSVPAAQTKEKLFVSVDFFCPYLLDPHTSEEKIKRRLQPADMWGFSHASCIRFALHYNFDQQRALEAHDLLWLGVSSVALCLAARNQRVLSMADRAPITVSGSSS